MKPANIPAENPLTRKRGRKRARLDPKTREIIGNEEVHGAETREIVPAGLAEKVRYSYRQYRKPDTPSTDRVLPQLSALQEIALDDGYQLCAACGKPVVSDEARRCRACGEPVVGSEASLAAPVLMIPGGKPWLLYLHPCCAQGPGWWMSKTFGTMWEMEKPFHTTCPPQLDNAMMVALVNSPVLELLDRRELRLKFYPKLWLPDAVKPGLWKEVDEDGVAIPGVYVSTLRLLVFIPFQDGCTRISIDRKVQVYEVGFPETRPTDEFTTLIDPRYRAAQFGVMGLRPSLSKDPVSDREFQADEFKLDRAMLKRMGGGGRRTSARDYDKDAVRNASKPSHPIFRNYIESEYALRLDHLGKLVPSARIWDETYLASLWPLSEWKEWYGQHVPVIAGPDKRTEYHCERVNAKNVRAEEDAAGEPVLTRDSKGKPAYYALWSDKIPYAPPEALEDGWEKYRPVRDEFKSYMLDLQGASRSSFEFNWQPVRDHEFTGRSLRDWEWAPIALAELERKVRKKRGLDDEKPWWSSEVDPLQRDILLRNSRGRNLGWRITFRLPDYLPDHIPLPRPVDVPRGMQIEKLPAVYIGGAPVLGGVPVEGTGKPPAPIQVSTRAGREHVANTLAFGWCGSGPRFGAEYLERYVTPKLLPGQVEEDFPSYELRWIPPPFPEYPPLLIRLTAQSRKAELPHKALTLVLESTLNPDLPEPAAVPTPPKGFRPDLYVLPRWRPRRRAVSLIVSQNLPGMNLLAARGRRAYAESVRLQAHPDLTPAS